eukprot:2439590-Rhodomonas_salina.1
MPPNGKKETWSRGGLPENRSENVTRWVLQCTAAVLDDVTPWKWSSVPQLVRRASFGHPQTAEHRGGRQTISPRARHY